MISRRDLDLEFVLPNLNVLYPKIKPEDVLPENTLFIDKVEKLKDVDIDKVGMLCFVDGIGIIVDKKDEKPVTIHMPSGQSWINAEKKIFDIYNVNPELGELIAKEFYDKYKIKEIYYDEFGISPEVAINNQLLSDPTYVFLAKEESDRHLMERYEEIGIRRSALLEPLLDPFPSKISQDEGEKDKTKLINIFKNVADVEFVENGNSLTVYDTASYEGVNEEDFENGKYKAWELIHQDPKSVLVVKNSRVALRNIDWLKRSYKEAVKEFEKETGKEAPRLKLFDRLDYIKDAIKKGNYITTEQDEKTKDLDKESIELQTQILTHQLLQYVKDTPLEEKKRLIFKSYSVPADAMENFVSMGIRLTEIYNEAILKNALGRSEKSLENLEDGYELEKFKMLKKIFEKISGWSRRRKIGVALAAILGVAGVAYAISDYLYKEDLRKRDSDKDGINDLREMELGTDPNKPTLMWDLNEVENSIGKLVPLLSKVRSDYSNIDLYGGSDLLQLTSSLKTNVPTFADNNWNSLNATSNYRNTQTTLLDRFGNLTNPSLSEDSRLALIRKWNESHSTLDTSNDDFGKNTVYWFIKEGMKNEIKAYDDYLNSSHLQACYVLSKEGIGAADRVKSILSCGELVYKNVLADCKLIEKCISFSNESLFIPGYVDLLELKNVSNELLRQLGIQLNPGESVNYLKYTLPFSRWPDVELKDRVTLNNILDKLDKESRDRFIQILDGVSSKYGPAQLSHLLDKLVGYEDQFAGLISGNGNTDIKDFSSLAHIASDRVSILHKGGMADKFYEKVYTVLPSNYRELSNIELTDSMNLPKFKYPTYGGGVTSIHDAWEKQMADCTGYTIIYNDVMSLAGRKAYTVMWFGPGPNSRSHLSSLFKEGEILYYYDALNRIGPLNFESYMGDEKNGGYNLTLTVSYPFLGGCVIWRVYNTFDGLLEEREIP